MSPLPVHTKCCTLFKLLHLGTNKLYKLSIRSRYKSITAVNIIYVIIPMCSSLRLAALFGVVRSDFLILVC